jgi:EmrB/QacA subfamily drug resistance transporter
VNVALPSIRTDLGFTETSLVWVVNAYMLTFGGFLLLGGRLGDLYGHRRLFLIGLVLFTLASLACGLANSQALLVTARAVQGLGGAVVSAVALSLIMNIFTEPADRAKAMGVYGFVCAGGGSIGVLLGGLLTSTLSWHWIFLVNLPIGVAVYALCLALLPSARGHAHGEKLDVAGAVAVTLSLMLAVYAIVNGNEAGWQSAQTLGLLGAAVVLMALFIAIEARVQHPLMPLGLFRLRSVSVSNVVGVLWAAAMFAWFFISALYMQLVLGYTPMQIGLAFLPANLIMALFSLGISARLAEKKKKIQIQHSHTSISPPSFSSEPTVLRFRFRFLRSLFLRRRRNHVSVYSILHSFTHSSPSPSPSLTIQPSSLLYLLPSLPSNNHQIHFHQSLLVIISFTGSRFIVLIIILASTSLT